MTLTVGSLFSGIGGFDLGLEWAGMKVIWQSEIDPYASAVLRKHWPHVPNLGDIHGIYGRDGFVFGNAPAGYEPAPRPTPDLICGGFPCQPFSSANAGRQRGKDDDRYLWPEMLRVIREVKPAWVCGENVAHIDRLALETVCSDLEACGYEVQTLEIPACAVDADHIRVRTWILGHANGNGKSRLPVDDEAQGLSQSLSAYPDGEPVEWTPKSWQERDWWEGWPDLDRVENGVPARMDRLRCLGNAIVPQIAEVIGRAIVEADMVLGEG